MKIEEILDYKLKKLLDGKLVKVDSDTNKNEDNKVAPLANVIPAVSEEDKKFVLAQAKSKIQAYCHRRDIPKEAYYIWADIAIELLKTIDSSLFEVDTTSESELAKRITSIKAGDTTIDVDAGSGSDTKDTGYKPNSNDDAIMNSFAKQLQAFRKIPAGCGRDLHGV